VAVLRPRLVADTNFVVEGIERPQHGVAVRQGPVR
jgi:hypothetical protein